MREETIRISPEEMAAQARFARDFSRLPGRPRTYFIVTYGCQMNAHDSEKLAGMLEDMGLTAAPAREEADFVLHNTCCIRDNAERKALGNVTWLKEIKKVRPEMLIGVCGCMVQEPGMAEKLLRQYPFVDMAFGTGNIYRLPELLYRAVETRRRVVSVPEEQSTLIEGLPIRRESDFQAYVTIMYGCNNFCSYCIVPYVRGRERSRSADDILREVEGLQEKGVQEIMLLGQNVNSYGNDTPGGISFPKLLRRLGQTGIPRIRFMTSHPKDLSDELIEEFAVNPALCRHMHLPVQSGSNGILQAMNRRYTGSITWSACVPSGPPCPASASPPTSSWPSPAKRSGILRIPCPSPGKRNGTAPSPSFSPPGWARRRRKCPGASPPKSPPSVSSASSPCRRK